MTERLWLTFVLRSMANSFTLPALGASLLIAAAAGIQLGESTIGMIKPIHFQGPAVHPRDRGAAVDETQVRSTEAGFASLYGWDEGRSAKIEDCGDCGALTARDSFVDGYQAPVTVYRATVEEWDEPAGSDEADDYAGRSEIEVRDFDAELKARVGRYAHYEIEAQEEVVEVHYPSELE